ncbi:MAG: hypothetical protein U0Y68_12145 [Blastocatellia bacterium]
MTNPIGVAVDPDGRLYVAEASHRVVIFNNAAAKGNGANADNVLGQPNFIFNIPNFGGLSATSLNNPTLLFFDPASYSLYVPDNFNNRVLRFSITQPSAPTLGAAHGQFAGFSLTTLRRLMARATRLTLSNFSNAAPTAANQVYVHLFFIDGTTCNQADLFACLTPNASISFKASEYDPGSTGYVIAVAVNNQGVPVQNNVLAGNAFLRTPQIADNYGAETFWANSAGVATVNGNTATRIALTTSATTPRRVSLPSKFKALDAASQQVVTVSLSGNHHRANERRGPNPGTAQVFNEQEVFGGFNGWPDRYLYVVGSSRPALRVCRMASTS